MTLIGLISDTHFQERLFDLPERLSSLWAGAGMILHAGDVGDLSVLDQLGRIAPVVAVHGNDEPEHVKRALPGQQLIAVHGRRVLLWHSHYPDPAEERAKRTGVWGPKLERIADYGRALGASIVVYGHTHVPMTYRSGDVLLFNPGALASGSYFSRQATASFGRLRIKPDGEFEVHHLDAATGQVTDFPAPDPDEEFGLLGSRYQESIVEPDLRPDVEALGRIVYDDVRAVVRAVVPLYRRCVHDGRMRREDLVEAIRAGEGITDGDRERVLGIIARNS